MQKSWVILVCLSGLLISLAPPSGASSTPIKNDFRSSPSSVKQTMALEFVKHHRLIGKTRQQISDLLGAPETYPDPAVCAVFALSDERIEKLPVRSLDLSFDNEGRVRSCRIAERVEQPSEGVFGEWGTSYSRKSETIFQPLKARQKQFNQAIWIDTQKSDRLDMVKDLLSNKKILGKSRTDVQALLGAPEYQINQNEDSYMLDRSPGKCGNAGSLRLDVKYSKSAVSAFRIASHFYQSPIGQKGNWIY